MTATTAFGAELRRRRGAAGLSQRQLAEALAAVAWEELNLRVGVDGNLVSRWERGSAVPRPPYPDLLCRLFRATPERLGLRAGLPSEPAASSTLPSLFEPTMKIVDRTRRAGSSNVSDTVLTQLERMTVSVVDEYELTGPNLLIPRLVEQRAWVEELFDGRQTLRQRARLFAVAARLSNLLGSLAIDRGDLTTAHAYCDDAFQLADMADNNEIRAWVRATQALAEYYAGDYPKCLGLAEAGLRFARGGSQEARLLAQGQARAAARLGDARTVMAAVERAQTLARPYQHGGVSACVAIDGYCSARIDGNIATAFVSLGRFTDARRFAFSALSRFDAAGMSGPRSLTRLDVALTYLADNEPAAAASIVVEALEISVERPTATLAARTGQVLQSGRRFLSTAPMRDLAALATDWHRAAPPALPAG
jgi:transcriptional regulator with XRE-family HTH domain